MAYRKLLAMTFKLSRAAGLLTVLATSDLHAQTITDVACQSPPVALCADACTAEQKSLAGNVVEPASRRSYFLDYPCDLKSDEKVTVVLNLHGAGSNASNQRRYFPIVDYKDKYRLVIITPTAGADSHNWSSAQDDEYLGKITDQVFSLVGAGRINTFWLAGHSQGGITATRIVCSPYFKGRVDGLLSLSGGRIGRIAYVESFFPAGRRPPAPPSGAAASPAKTDEAAAFDCNFSYMFSSGANEITGLPETSPLAQKYGCEARVRGADVVDDKPGYVSGADREEGPNPAWSTHRMPGTAQVYRYPGCNSGRLVADIMRLNKGHTDGLEPKVTEAIVAMMVAAPGKARP
ncbi:MAG: alpha/beta hydrolase [Pseudomonadota bacterium]